MLQRDRTALRGNRECGTVCRPLDGPRCSRMKCTVTALGLLTLATSCMKHDAGPTAPGQQSAQPQLVPGRLLSWTPLSNVGDPGGLVSQAPTVRVADSTGFIPIPGVLVRFKITGGGGA